VTKRKNRPYRAKGCEPRKVLNVCFPPELYGRLLAVCSEAGLSRSYFIARLVESELSGKEGKNNAT
jgi:hypothetical protein